MKSNSEKPFYLKKWFIILCVIIGLTILGSILNALGYEAKPKEIGNQVISNSESSDIDASSDDTSELSEDDKTFEVNWDDAIEDTYEELYNNESLTYVKDLYIDVDEDKKQITLSAVVSDSTNNDTILDFGDTFIRRFGSNVNLFGGEYESPTKNSYGGLYDNYSAIIIISRSSTDSNNAEVFQMITKKTHQKLRLK